MSVLYEKSDHIVKITLNRPENMNAFNRQMVEELEQSILDFRGDSDAWVAILTGAGDKAFSAGLDLKEHGNVDEVLNNFPNMWDSFYHQSFTHDSELYKPIIAAVNGYCVGFGMNYILSCDLRLCIKEAIFRVPEVTLGLPNVMGAIKAARLLGMGHTLELLLLGEARDADWALRTGLVNEIVEDGQLEERAFAWASRLCQVGPLAMRCTREVALRSREMSLFDSIRMGEALRRSALYQGNEIYEGIAAVKEKRKPKFEIK